MAQTVIGKVSSGELANKPFTQISSIAEAAAKRTSFQTNQLPNEPTSSWNDSIATQGSAATLPGHGHDGYAYQFPQVIESIAEAEKAYKFILESKLLEMDERLENLEQKQSKWNEDSSSSQLKHESKLLKMDERLQNLEQAQTKSNEDPSSSQLKDAAVAVPVADDGEEDQTSIDFQEEYHFEESVYDAAFFAFTTHVSLCSSLFVITGLLVNLVLQAGVIGILMSQFTDDPLPEQSMKRLKSWRASEGHAYYNADPVTGVSLVARVCAGDFGLSTSIRQTDINEDALLYSDWNTGQILCMISMALWSFTCALELRKSVEFVLALQSIPRTQGRSTIAADPEGLHIVDLSVDRLLIGFVVAAIRSVIAVLLLIYGSWWLAYTTSVKDLLLNASALGFVLDIDDMIFLVLSPAKLIGLMDSVQPLKLPASRLTSCLPFALGIGLLSFLCAMEVTFVAHVRDQLTLAHNTLCSEGTELNFIVGSTEFDWLFYAEAVQYDMPEHESVTAKREAIQFILDDSPEKNKGATKVSASQVYKNADLVQTIAERPLAEAAQMLGACVDRDGPQLGARLWVATGDRAFLDVATCAAVKIHCIGAFTSILAQNVRFMCPITCGCGDPTSGIFDLARNEAGCPWGVCQILVFNAASEFGGNTYGCQDESLSVLQAQPTWSTMLHLMNEANVINSFVMHELNSTGCTPFQSLPFLNRTIACGTFNMWNLGEKPYFGAGIMCPESCGCYYDYGSQPDVPEEFALYQPGDAGICPMQSCWDRHYNSYLAYEASQSSAGD